MPYNSLRVFGQGFGPLAVLSILLLSSLWVMSLALQNADQFGKLYSLLLLANMAGLIVLLLLISSGLTRLISQYRKNVTGSRVTLRLVIVLVVLSILPVSVVYYFSIDFLQRGIDSWFDVKVEKALTDALEISRVSLDEKKRELLVEAKSLAKDLSGIDGLELAAAISSTEGRRAEEVTVFDRNGQILALRASSIDKGPPDIPSERVLKQVRQGDDYIGFDAIQGLGMHIRVVLSMPPNRYNDARMLQVLQPFPEKLSGLINRVQRERDRYSQLAYLQDDLKFSFTLALSLVLLLSLFTAIWLALFSARRLAAPIRALAIGTRALAAGDYHRRLPITSKDELGFLVQSFNEMTYKISSARDEARLSQQHVERQRVYLEVVLGRLSSGVMTFNQQHQLLSANIAVENILGVDLTGLYGKTVEQLKEHFTALAGFFELLEAHFAEPDADWKEEVVLALGGGKQFLTCGGALLPVLEAGEAGYVLVVDDVTGLVNAQRDSAWGEVARRMAHEIKNPLTPIQLSAERLRHKYLEKLPAEDSEILDRATKTIVNQVETMKRMVKSFAEYARSPKLLLEPVDINILVGEVLDLYRDDSRPQLIKMDLAVGLAKIQVDSGRIRQLLHNLMKNALDAMECMDEATVCVETNMVEVGGMSFVELTLADNGSGIDKDLVDSLFEPYITTKPKGSGLGLAIVRKIVEEHRGSVVAFNQPGAGAVIRVRLPGK